MSGRTRRSAASWSRTGASSGRGWTQPSGRPHAESEAIDARRRGRAWQHGLCHARALRASRPHAALHRPHAGGRHRPGRGRGRRPRPAGRRQGHRAAARSRDPGRGRLPGGRGAPAERRLFLPGCASAGRWWRSSSRPAPTAGSPPPRATASGSPGRRPGPRVTACGCATTPSWSAAARPWPTTRCSTCRLPGLEDRSPVRVVLDRRLRLPPGSRLARSAGSPAALAVHHRDRVGAAAAQLRSRRRDAVFAARADAATQLRAMLAILAGAGITRLLVEGGATRRHRLPARGTRRPDLPVRRAAADRRRRRRRRRVRSACAGWATPCAGGAWRSGCSTRTGCWCSNPR